MGVVLRHCLASPCEDANNPQQVTGFAMLTLKSVVDVTWAHDSTNEKSYPVAEGSEFVVEAQIDPVTGCWETACEIPCNSDLSPAGTYWEVVEVINGGACGPAEFVQLDCANNSYPNPTLLPTVTLTNPSPAGVNAISQLVADTLAFTFNDANGITLTQTGVGVAGDPLIVTPALIPDPNPANALTIGPDGIMVTVPDQVVVAPDAGGIVNRLVETADGLLVDVLVAVDDTESVDLTLTGAGTTVDPWLITADVVVANDPNNILRQTVNGLIVEAVGFLEASGSDGITIDLTGTGTAGDPHQLTATLVTNPDPTNAVTIDANGIYVPRNLVVDADTPTVETTVAGTGTVLDPWVVSSAIRVDTISGDNILTATVDGVRVPAYALQVDDTTSINSHLTGVGSVTSPWIVSSEIIVDPASTAVIAVTPDGLRVNETQRDDGLELFTGDGLTSSLTGSGRDLDPWIAIVNLDLEGSSGLEANPTGLAVLIDPASTSEVSLSPTGLRIDETPLLVTLNGALAGVTQTGDALHNADIRTLSADGGNLLSIGGDGGLYINSAAISALIPADVFLDDSDFNEATKVLTLSLSDGNSYPIDLSTLIDTYQLAVTSSTSVALNLTGAGTTADPWDVTANVVRAPGGGIDDTGAGLELLIDPASTAIVATGAAGLRVDQTPLVVTTDGTIAGVAQTGVANHTVDIRLRSAIGGNALVSGIDGGVFLDEARFDIGNIDILDSQRIDFGITGAGTALDPYIITGDLFLNGDFDNVATLEADGIKAVSYERLEWSIPFFVSQPVPLGSYIFAPGEITDVAIVAGTAPAGGIETWEMRINGVLESTGTLPAGSTAATFPAADFPLVVAEGDIVTCAPVGAAPPTPSTLTTVSARMTGGI